MEQKIGRREGGKQKREKVREVEGGREGKSEKESVWETRGERVEKAQGRERLVEIEEHQEIYVRVHVFSTHFSSALRGTSTGPAV